MHRARLIACERKPSTSAILNEGTMKLGLMAGYSGATGRDLSGADLSNANLSDADLSKADLSGADLHGVTLEGANPGVG